MKILVINGPNLNMLGIREPDIYGKKTFADLLQLLEDTGRELNIEIEQWTYGKVDGIVINPAAYTHTSVAILDALKAVGIPAVEVHISDVDSREPFRQISYAGLACCRTIKGHGFAGYREAIEYLDALLNHRIS